VEYTYDDLNRLTNVTNYAPFGATISSYEYVLNNAGIRTAVIEHDGSRVDYGYDDLYRLTSETRTGLSPYNIAYTYDNVGNRLTKDHDGQLTAYDYNTRDQLETETPPAETITYDYDDAGRQISKTDSSGTTTYTWLDGDRLDSVATAAETISYAYDADGIKVSVDDGTIKRNYLIDTQQQHAQLVAEYDNTNSLVAEYVFGLERISQDRASTISVYLADGQGSIRQLTDNIGTLTDTYDYYAFGEELSKTGTTENEFKYVGEAFDPNIGFYYLRARWMDPKNGRFVSVDSFGGHVYAPNSFHKYLYADQSPVTFSDPLGLFTLGGQMQAIGNILQNIARTSIIKLLRVGVTSGSISTGSYTVSVVFGKLFADEEEGAVSFSLGGAARAFGYGFASGVIIKYKISSKAGIIIFNGVASVVSGAEGRATDSDETSSPSDFAEIVTDATVGVVAGWLGLFGGDPNVVKGIRVVVTGPIVGTAVKKARRIPETIRDIEETVGEAMYNIERQIINQYRGFPYGH
jgi:RHS repeat-associated protein